MKRPDSRDGKSRQTDSSNEVDALANGVGRFVHAALPLPHRPGAVVAVFRQILDADRFSVAFESGGKAFQVLANDQNRFSPPRSLPPILALDAGDGVGDIKSYSVVRYAYSDEAFQLLEDMLAGGHVLTMNAFLELTWSLAQVLAFLHEHDVVHGQWNARSVVAIPVDGDGMDVGHHDRVDRSRHRYEVFNTGVCYRDPGAIPREYIEHDYYPREVFLSDHGAPDYGALDIVSDVYCFASFLKDLMQRACSTEELPSQSARILEELQKEANRRGFKGAPDALRLKELEILDHLYTIKVRTESLIQEGMRPRSERCDARRILELAEDLHEKSTTYVSRLFAGGFAPINVFGADLQHYTTFRLDVSPSTINSFDNADVVLTGADLPTDMVRITLNESHEGVHVVSSSSTEASQGRIVFRVEGGYPSGQYRISINNRRTNGVLHVYAPEWRALEPAETHRPWEGFDNVRLTVRGRRLPVGARYTLWSLLDDHADEDAAESAAGDRTAAGGDDQIEVVTAELLTVGVPAAEEPAAEEPAAEETAAEETAAEDCEADEATVVLEIPSETAPGRYSLNANFLETGLEVRVGDRLDDPVLAPSGLSVDRIKNHRDQRVQMVGSGFHPAMMVDLLATADLSEIGVTTGLEVTSPRSAVLTIPAGFPAGEFVLRLNYRDTGSRLSVVEPRWHTSVPAVLKLGRDRNRSAVIALYGSELPGDLGEDLEYSLLDRAGRKVRDGVVHAEVVNEEDAADQESEEGVTELSQENTAGREQVHRIKVAATLPRGRLSVCFGGRATGLRIRVRRQMPRAVAAVLAVILIVGVVAGTAFLRGEFAPRIASVAPSIAFDFDDIDLEIEGEHLSRVQLWTEGGERVADVPVREASDRMGKYTCTLSGVSPGVYRVRSATTWFGEARSDDRLTVRAPGFHVTPSEIRRLFPNRLQLGSVEGFDANVVSRMELYRVGGAERFAEFEVHDGRVDIPADRFAAADVGSFEVRLDGRRSGAVLTLVGPMLERITPNPVTIDADGRVEFEVLGTHIDANLWMGAAEIVEGAAPEVRTLPASSSLKFTARLPPGEHQLWWGRDEESAESIPGGRLRVLPAPIISDVRPRKLLPGRRTNLVFAGINLTGLDKIRLRPAGASPADASPADASPADASPADASMLGLEIPLEPEKVVPEGELDGRFEYAVALRSGVYLVEPASLNIQIEVFDDCKKLLEAFENDSDPLPLLSCLREQKPQDDVLDRAASLMFDRGLFAEAAETYARLRAGGSSQARFRAAFLRTFLDRKSISAFEVSPSEVGQGSSYSAAARSLGWVDAKRGVFAPAADLPWELEFVRASTADSPGVAVAAFLRSIRKKTKACGGLEVAGFEPAQRGYANARVRHAIQLVGAGQTSEARAVFATMVSDSEAWRRLERREQALSLFWHGHLELWYGGASDAAVRAFASAVANEALAGETATSWSRDYLGVLDPSTVPSGDGRDGVVSLDPALRWESLFVSAFRFYREVSQDPNFNLLTEERDSGVYLSPSDRSKSVELHQVLGMLEDVEAADPMAHFALLFYLRGAQQTSWPGESGGAKAAAHRLKLATLEIGPELQDLRGFFLLFGDLHAMELTQFKVLPHENRKTIVDRLQAASAMNLPGEYGGLREGLRKRFLTPSTVWRSR